MNKTTLVFVKTVLFTLILRENKLIKLQKYKKLF